MNLLSWVLSLSIFLSLFSKAVTFHKATVCRQKAWLKSTELFTRTLLTEKKDRERLIDLDCQLHVRRHKTIVDWIKIPSSKVNPFSLKFRGQS